MMDLRSCILPAWIALPSGIDANTAYLSQEKIKGFRSVASEAFYPLLNPKKYLYIENLVLM
jgi:hypothetical protein